jgi:hypothetical protein
MQYDFFRPLMRYDALSVVLVILKLLGDLLDFKVLVFYYVWQVFLLYLWVVIQIVYGLLVLRRLNCLLLLRLHLCFACASVR